MRPLMRSVRWCGRYSVDAASVSAWTLVLTLLASAVVTAEQAHVHGSGEVNVAVDEEEVLVELRLTAADAFGFEHAPGDERQHRHVQQVAELLADPARLFTLSPAAECVARASDVDVPWLHEDGDSDPHTRSSGTAHGPADTAAARDHHDEDEHRDVHAEYHFDCGQPKRLRAIDVRVFERLPSVQRLRAQFVTAQRQGVVALTPDYHRLDL